MNFIAAISLTTYHPASHLLGISQTGFSAHDVYLRSVKFLGRRSKGLLTKKGIGQDTKRQIADSFVVNKLSISPVWDFLMSYHVTILKLRSPGQN